ncbi:MAG: hypothetical protein ACPG6P_10725, partial [Akkermansiaceae bacterium]
MKPFILTRLAVVLAPLMVCGDLLAQETTTPVGVVKITVSGAPSGGTRLSVIAASLRRAVLQQGQASSLDSFVGGDTPSQALHTGATGWAADQWTAEPHLCYLENAQGAEEAYLIIGNTASGELVLSTLFDLQTRYPASPSYRICRANTLGSLFGTGTV